MSALVVSFPSFRKASVRCLSLPLVCGWDVVACDDLFAYCVPGSEGGHGLAIPMATRLLAFSFG